MLFPRIKRQRSRGRGVIELCLSREQVKSRDIQIQLSACERTARVNELNLVDHTLVPLAAGNAKRGTRGLGSGVCSRQRVRRGVQFIQGLLDLQLNLLLDLVTLSSCPACDSPCAARSRTSGAA